MQLTDIMHKDNEKRNISSVVLEKADEKGGSLVMQTVKPQLQVKNLTFGGGSYLMCVSLADGRVDDLLHNAVESLKYQPDLFEWRVDGFEEYPDPGAVLITLEQLRRTIGGGTIQSSLHQGIWRREGSGISVMERSSV